jgi:hypothetical protein
LIKPMNTLRSSKATSVTSAMFTENDEARMSNDEGMTKWKKQTVPFVIRISSFASFVA